MRCVYQDTLATAILDGGPLSLAAPSAAPRNVPGMGPDRNAPSLDCPRQLRAASAALGGAAP
eukprot:14681767-Alexandrium_andersonii.AAC.1